MCPKFIQKRIYEQAQYITELKNKKDQYDPNDYKVNMESAKSQMYYFIDMSNQRCTCRCCSDQ